MATNTFQAQQVALRAQLYLQPSSTFKLQIYLCSGLLGFSLLITLAALLLRWRSRQFWLFKITVLERGRFLAPHPIILWLLASTIFLVLAEIVAHKSVTSVEVGTDLSNWVAWRTFLWLSLWVGAWSIAWATTLASILPRPTHPLARQPILLTSFFLVTPCLLFAIVTPLIVIANARFNDLFAEFKSLDSALSAASEALRDEELVPAWRNAWIALGVLTVFMLIVFTVAAISHFTTIGGQMSHLKSQKVTTGDSYSRQQRQLQWAFRSLVFTTATLFLLAVAYIILVFIISANTSELADGGNFGEKTSLASLWIFSVFGTLTNFILFLRSFASTPRPASAAVISSRIQYDGPKSPSIGRSGREVVGRTSDIQVSVVREVETTFEREEREADLGAGKGYDRYEVELDAYPAEKIR
ncbi:hypothetical protein BCR35DRAFT_332034 [Leucosporidium creatinivorum]|uniref:Uncharacterized protein n=1 Tax=Leucosporidium creatinivorum TaxID=106004 RepID=A0A1Y2F7E5_9BASI|nr:hypothetical protein BCR35DRAFT_332034 [Leucosporidium creatinivorum]